MSDRQFLLRNQDLNICQPLENTKKNVQNDRKRPALQEQGKSKFADSKNPIGTAKRQRIELDPSAVDERFKFDTMQAKVLEAYAEFAPDVFRYMKHVEASYQITNYVRERGFSKKNRAILIDWLVENHESYRYTNETLYISVYLIDSFLAAYPDTPTNKLQLVAVTALFIASKYEEYAAPSFSELLEFSNGAYVTNDILILEMQMLAACGGRLGVPLSYSFLRRYARVTNADIQTVTLARFYLELSLYYPEFAIEERPSKLGAAALVLAFRTKGVKHEWEDCLEHYSGYQIGEIEVLADRLGAEVKQFKKMCPKCEVTEAKYSDSNYYEVAKGAFAQ